MRWLWSLLLLGVSANAHKLIDCPLLGPAFPAPTALSKDPLFLRVSEQLTLRLNEAIENGTLPSISFAVQVFSAQEDESAFGFYHTDDPITVGTVGVNEINEDTVFRIGSISKLWTMFLYMTIGGTRYFQEPVSKYVPELRTSYNLTQATNTLGHVQWSDVTIGELASHQAGILRDYGPTDLGFQWTTLQNQGFPALSKLEQLTCGNDYPCARKEFFDGVFKAHPMLSTSYTPTYSNAGYQILGYALESVLNSKYADILADRLIKPLNLTRSSLHAPDPRLAVIPHNETSSMFNYLLGDEDPAGAIFSSPKDMASFGRAILSNALVDPVITRRWLKPATHTSSLRFSVGAPWEIYSFSTPRRIDLYTKAGDIGMYSSFLGLSPDHDAGFTVLVAGENSHQMTSTISELVADILLPSLDNVAKNQALERFVGTYALTGDTFNSSITITADDGPGLRVEEWISNSVDMYETLMTLQHVTDRSAISIRLQPNGLQTSDRVGFSGVIYALPIPPNTGPILGSCISWIALESLIYANIGLSEFEFGLDDRGDAMSISPRALRVTLPRL